MPDVLLLDEPLSGQDAESQDVFVRKVKELQAEEVADSFSMSMACIYFVMAGAMAISVGYGGILSGVKI